MGNESKTLIVAINTKYEHESLAVWYLKAACLKKRLNVSVKQYVINDPLVRIFIGILDEAPDIVAFSCYIWNREMVMHLISDLKKAKPSLKIIVGGPEVTDEESQSDMLGCGADYVLKGPGESSFPALVASLQGEHGNAFESGYGFSTQDSSHYLSPFLPEHLERMKDRIAYIESSRGCAYRCSYCLSSECGSLFFFSPEEVRDDIEALVKAGTRVIKFVDRSFNINEPHALKIWEYVKQYAGKGITFHFEINADRLTQKQLDILESLPDGLIQLEAGIQSVNPDTLKAVDRVMDVELALENLKRLIGKQNIHIHADLIAGLPLEDIHSFENAFNRLYSLRPHHLQLGFLKLIRGTKIRRQAEQYGYQYREYPPYEVISSNTMGAADIILLKGIEEVLDRFYNSGRMIVTLDYLETFFSSSFNFYNSLHLWMKKRELLFQPVSATRLFEIVDQYVMEESIGVVPEIFYSLMCLDYICSTRTTLLPESLSNRALAHSVRLPDIRDVLEEAHQKDMGKRELRKRFIALEAWLPVKKGADFKYERNNIVLDMKQVHSVTGRLGFRWNQC